MRIIFIILVGLVALGCAVDRIPAEPPSEKISAQELWQTLQTSWTWGVLEQVYKGEYDPYAVGETCMFFVRVDYPMQGLSAGQYAFREDYDNCQNTHWFDDYDGERDSWYERGEHEEVNVFLSAEVFAHEIVDEPDMMAKLNDDPSLASVHYFDIDGIVPEIGRDGMRGCLFGDHWNGLDPPEGFYLVDVLWGWTADRVPSEVVAERVRQAIIAAYWEQDLWLVEEYAYPTTYAEAIAMVDDGVVFAGDVTNDDGYVFTGVHFDLDGVQTAMMMDPFEEAPVARSYEGEITYCAVR